MYFVITDNQIYKNRTLKGLNKKMKGNMEQEEFEAIGRDFVTLATDTDIQFIQDKKRLQSVAINKLFKKNGTDKILMVLILILSIITSIRV